MLLILFITSTFDPHVDYLIEQTRHDFFRLNTDEYLDYHQINFEVTSNSIKSNIINNSGVPFDVKSITSAYYRRPEIPKKIINILDDNIKQLVEAETKEFLRQFYHSYPEIKWLCSPWKIYFARGRLNQLVQAKKMGFKIPQTLFTSSKEELLKFFNKCNQKIIIKTINSGSCVKHKDDLEPIYTEVIDSTNIDALNFELLKNSPSLFQEFIDAEYELRITSVGIKNFSVKITSNITDWRKRDALPSYSTYDLPTAVSEGLSKYLEYYKLNFGCFDLMKGKNGEYYFLELNPNGQWLWLELETGIPIGKSIVDFLEATQKKYK